MKYNINIIGYGFVGQAIGNLLIKNKILFNVYDIIPKMSLSFFLTLNGLVKTSETNNHINIYFICVPTPSDPCGNCDTSIVKNVIKQLSELISKESIIIIKSTIKPGTTREINYLYKQNKNIDIVFSPEFLREVSSNTDMYNTKQALFGIGVDSLQFPTLENYILKNKIEYLFKNILYSHKKIKWYQRFSKKFIPFKIYFGTFEEMELVKYTINSFLAVKVWYFNEIYELCEKLNIDYQIFKKLFPLEPRLGTYGQQVPGYDGKFGFGLSCLPKEILGMRQLQQELELPSNVLYEIIQRNNQIRSKIFYFR
jgi:UDPglucose 6-dehydrogenase